MDTKSVLKNPENAIQKHWGDINNCFEKDNILEVCEHISQLATELTELKTKKQLCSRAFKEAKQEPDVITQLKQDMQTISKRYKETEANKKRAEKELKGYFLETIDTPLPSLPKQFLASDTHSDNDKTSHCEIATDDEADNWNQYIASHPNASLYHHFEWKLLIEQSFGHQGHYFMAKSQGHIVGVLPCIRLSSRLFGDFAVSQPYFNYGGALANSNKIAVQLMEYAAQYYQGESVSHLEIRTNHQALCQWPHTTDKVSMIRQLPSTMAKLEQELGSKIRAQINRAPREKTERLIGGKELLNDFYQVFARNMRDLGTPVYAKSFFANILQQWPDQATIIVIKLHGKPVSTAFLLGHRDILEIPWASTLKEANPLNINMLLYREVLNFAIEQGYDFFDFGRSTMDAGTYRFKKQWGAKPVQHYWYYWLSDGQPLPKLKPDNPKFALAIAVWKRLPVALTKILGPGIVKNLP